jgi:uncharacterized RDD family membrane protein YckC
MLGGCIVQDSAVTGPGVSAAYAGFVQRLVSLIIDAIILGVVNGIVSAVLGGAMRDSGQTLASAIGIIISLVYEVYFFTSTGQTIGMKIMNIKLVDANGQLLSTGSAVVRVIVAYVSGIILLIGYLMMLWDSKKQTLHDKAAGSYVIRV